MITYTLAGVRGGYAAPEKLLSLTASGFAARRERKASNQPNLL
jgi:hypothetical protein